MGDYQRVFEDQISRVSDTLLRELVSKKIEQQNIRLSRECFEKLIDHLLTGAKGEFSIPDEDIEFIDRDPGELKLKFTKKDITEMKRRSDLFVAGIPKMLRKMVKNFSKDIVKRSKRQWAEDYPLRKAETNAFSERLRYRWRDGLIPLNVMLEVTREFASSMLEKHQDTIGSNNFSVKKDVLFGLHNRACQVTAEVITLLEAGYADGAMARWRTLHELTIVADLIHDGDESLAVRYLDHNAVDSKKAAERYMQTIEFTGYEPISDEELAEINANYENVIQKHGKSFGKEYGWASLAVNNPNPRFVDLIIKSGRQSLQSYYKMASFNIHANARSLFFRHTNMESYSGVIAGASNAGLEDPGTNTAYALCQITVLLMPDDDPEIDDYIAIETLRRLRDKTEKGFRKAYKKLEDEDREYLELQAEYADFDLPY